MKLIVLAVVLPFVAGECPELAAPPACAPAELLCHAAPMPNGCPMPGWCQWVDPYAKCSARAHCPVTCGVDQIHCPGGIDDDGCPMPDTCMHHATTDSATTACPATSMCPVTCGSNQLMCGGHPDPWSTNGCIMPFWCMDYEPTAICQSHCPVYCGPNEMLCYGGTDSIGCAMPDSCMPMEGMYISNTTY